MGQKKLQLGYKISRSKNFMKTLYAIPHRLNVQLDDLYRLAMEGEKSSIRKFTKIIEEYPKVPAVKNFLSVLYSKMGKIKKSQEINHWIVSEHPDYLFGKLNLASEYFARSEYDNIPKVLGEFMDLKKLYPDRDTFHISEVSGFLKMAVLYFSATEKLEQAETQHDILWEIAPDSVDFEIANEYFYAAKMEADFTKTDNTKEHTIDVEVKKTVLTDIETPPEFVHKEINLLYENNFFLDKKIIAEILELPRHSLIEDLNKVLNDSIVRFNYFKKNADNGWGDEKYNTFVIHTLIILAEIEATESLENVLEVLRQDIDYLDFYIGVFINEFMWLIIYKIAASNLDTCKQFMFEPGIYTYSKCAVSEMASQIAQHHEERKEEIVEWFRDVVRFFAKSNLNENVIDSNLLGLLVADVLDMKDTELMPEIEELYEKEFVSLDVCGDIDEVKKIFSDNNDEAIIRNIISIYDIYEGIKGGILKVKNNYYDGQENLFDVRSNYHRPAQVINTEKKTGRNDPCPCGSGKKYKKCCLNK